MQHLRVTLFGNKSFRLFVVHFVSIVSLGASSLLGNDKITRVFIVLCACVGVVCVYSGYYTVYDEEL